MELGSQLGPQSKQINPSIQFRNIVPKVYSHPHSALKRIPTGNQRMGSCQIRVTLTSPQMSKVVIAEIHIQLVGIKGTQQLHFIIPTT
jgi:hypothetical protein